MLFSSFSYLVFLPCAVLSFWLLPHRYRSALLLAASTYFYMSWIPIYGVLLAALTVVNYFAGRIIYSKREAGNQGQAKGWLVAAIVANLATLSYFKYTDFAIGTWNSVVECLGPVLGKFLAFHPGALTFPLQHVLLPLGISFFVFEFIHYITDIYKGGKPIFNFINFSLFAAFFPSQIAGPIKRYQDFIKQLEAPRVFSSAKFEAGLMLLLQGLFKKMALADNLSPIVTQGFSHATALGGAEAWMASLAFAIQIYCDFSGYTDMGRGSAMLMGFDLPDNFNWPYMAKSLTDFWKRWHISLSSWLRDYLYIPLGGNKCSANRQKFNLLATMLLGGLWHGASWHFVVWGAFHGLGLIVNHTYDALLKKSESGLAGALKNFHASSAGTVFSMFFTFAFVLVGWVFFRAETVGEAMAVLHGMFSPATSTVLADVVEKHPVFAALGVYGVYRILWDNGGKLAAATPDVVRKALRPLLPARIVIYASVFVMAVGLAPATASPFIYFAF